MIDFDESEFFVSFKEKLYYFSTILLLIYFQFYFLAFAYGYFAASVVCKDDYDVDYGPDFEDTLLHLDQPVLTELIGLELKPLNFEMAIDSLSAESLDIKTDPIFKDERKKLALLAKYYYEHENFLLSKKKKQIKKKTNIIFDNTEILIKKEKRQRKKVSLFVKDIKQFQKKRLLVRDLKKDLENKSKIYREYSIFTSSNSNFISSLDFDFHKLLKSLGKK